MSMSVGVVEGSVGEGLSMKRDIGWWKMSVIFVRYSSLLCSEK